MGTTWPFVRQNRIQCGERFLYVEIFQYSEKQQSGCRKKRKRREQLTPPKQINLNEKNARRYFTQLVNANFTEADYKLDLTYSEEFLPKTLEEDERNVENFLRRVNYARKKAGLPPAKRIWIPTGGQISEKTGKPTRIHHHLLISGGLDRDFMESLWKTRGKKGKRLGYANCDRLQATETGLERYANYISKQGNRARRWRPSKNLTKPERTTSDSKYTCHKLKRICSNGDIWRKEFWENKYPGFTLAGAPDLAVEASEPDEINANWRVYVRLRRIREHKRRRNRE